MRKTTGRWADIRRKALVGVRTASTITASLMGRLSRDPARSARSVAAGTSGRGNPYAGKTTVENDR